MPVQHARDRIEERVRAGVELGAIGHEVDLVDQGDAVLFDRHPRRGRAPAELRRARFVGTRIDAIRDAILVAIRERAARVVDRTGSHRAAVLWVQHAVLVGVLLRAAVVVLHVVGVLRLARALVERVRDPISVRVRALVGAAVAVLESVPRLGFAWTRIGRVQDPVLVVVEIGAAVLVLETIGVLWLERAFVGRIENPVLVVVRIGAAVVVLEPVEILGTFAAELVTRDQAGANPEDRPDVGHAPALHQAGSDRREHRHVRVEIPRQTRAHFEWGLGAVLQWVGRAEAVVDAQVELERGAPVLGEAQPDAELEIHLVVDAQPEDLLFAAQRVAQVERHADHARGVADRDARRERPVSLPQIAVAVAERDRERGQERERHAVTLLTEELNLGHDAEIPEPSTGERRQIGARPVHHVVARLMDRERQPHREREEVEERERHQELPGEAVIDQPELGLLVGVAGDERVVRVGEHRRALNVEVRGDRAPLHVQDAPAVGGGMEALDREVLRLDHLRRLGGRG